MKPLTLIGFMGVGKTTVGKALSQKLGKPLIDTDQEIVKYEGRSIPEIFADSGEAYFRKVESSILEDQMDKDLIISTGGGIVTNERSREYLKNFFHNFWLDASLEVVEKRISDDEERPLWKVKREARIELFNKRRKLYEAVADHRISVDHLEVNELVEEISKLYL
ncbi:shikimate kinase [Halalkalibacillus sediminis]|uniref:Shikimate kinase n=1 Tax=Halalkalibacillus sediminis TaxID=2018042 RepID=A0A2I0QXZ7_9BACI|nr:shikimate kinase [Halalkalibacillus sediminis]PKR78980.1 shikimate kinase [Halalkalibacillus sediminis]